MRAGRNAERICCTDARPSYGVGMKSLEEIATLYATIRPLSAGARYLIGRTLELLAEHVGHVPFATDLTDETISSFLASLESRYAKWTVAGHRTRILCLWRFAAKRMFCAPPGEVRAELPPEPQPESWSLDEVRRLLAACAEIGEPGRYLHALILAAFETGLRRGDLWALRREQIGTDGTIRGVRQRKTGVPIEISVRPETAAEILAIPGAMPLACPWCCRAYTAHWRRLRLAAGLEESGACQQLRRSGATWVAVDEGMDAARRFLGHRTDSMVRHYVDRSRLPASHPLPPRVA